MKLLRERGERGSALVIVMVVIAMLAVLGTTIMISSQTRRNASVEGRYRAEALAAAEAGVGLALDAINGSNGAVLDPDEADNIIDTPMVFQLPTSTWTDPDSGKAYGVGAGATVTVTVENLGENDVDDNGDGNIDDSKENNVVRLVSTAEITGLVGAGNTVVRRRIEAYLKTQIHPLFYKATFVGNQDDTPDFAVTFGPGNGSPNSNPNTNKPSNGNIANMTHSQNADFIDGDVYVNGDLQITGGSQIFGDLDTTGAVTGKPATGTTNEGADKITPPDLAAQDYENIADYVVDGSIPVSWIKGQQSSSYYGSTLGNSANHTLPYYHLGSNLSTGAINIPNSDSGKLIYIKGNLWLHSTSVLQFNLPSGGDVQVTIVVEGNIFIADDLNYNNDNNALLLIAKGVPDQESYVDANGNYAYDAGETIINDNGTAGYQGPKEGSGNVFFGDPRFGTGGITDGYIYAENNVYLVNKGTEGSYGSEEHYFGVTGFLSSGRQLILGDRKAGNKFDNFRVSYDPRLENGDVSFKGLPGPVGGGYEGLLVVSWREVPPTDTD